MPHKVSSISELWTIFGSFNQDVLKFSLPANRFEKKNSHRDEK